MYLVDSGTGVLTVVVDPARNGTRITMRDGQGERKRGGKQGVGLSRHAWYWRVSSLMVSTPLAARLLWNDAECGASLDSGSKVVKVGMD